MDRGTTTAATATTTAVVVGIDGSRRSLDVVRRAAVVAQTRDEVLHVVAAYDLRDTTAHRLHRAVAPADIGHVLSPVGEAEVLLREALDALTGVPVDVLMHARQGTTTSAVRRVAKETGGRVFVDHQPASPVRTTYRRLASALGR